MAKGGSAVAQLWLKPKAAQQLPAHTGGQEPGRTNEDWPRWPWRDVDFEGCP